jgi:hypothetical protein
VAQGLRTPEGVREPLLAEHRAQVGDVRGHAGVVRGQVLIRHADYRHEGTHVRVQGGALVKERRRGPEQRLLVGVARVGRFQDIQSSQEISDACLALQRAMDYVRVEVDTYLDNINTT